MPDDRAGGHFHRLRACQGILRQDVPVSQLPGVPAGRSHRRGARCHRGIGARYRRSGTPDLHPPLPGMRRGARAGGCIQFQPDVPDRDRPRFAAEGIPPSGDGPGDVHGFPASAPVLPRQAPVWCGPDREVLQKRDIAAAGHDTAPGVYAGRGRDLCPSRREGPSGVFTVRRVPCSASLHRPAGEGRATADLHDGRSRQGWHGRQSVRCLLPRTHP